MTVNEFWTLTAALMAGMLLGAVFFGGLWLTVRHGLSSAAAPLWFVGSFLIRTLLVLVGFRIAYGDEWKRLIAALVGFAVARFTLAWLIRSSGRSMPKPAIAHAP